MIMFKIYTDGSTLGNGKEENYGSWAYTIHNSKGELLGTGFDSEINTTNNRMELVAIIKALTSLPIQSATDDEIIEVYTDSAYVHNCYKDKWYIKWQNNGWVNSKKEPVKNQDLWEILIPFFKKENIHFQKVKGHENCVENNYVDNLAVTEATRRKNSLEGNK